jgi:hypothetical protein
MIAMFVVQLIFFFFLLVAPDETPTLPAIITPNAAATARADAMDLLI